MKSIKQKGRDRGQAKINIAITFTYILGLLLGSSYTFYDWPAFLVMFISGAVTLLMMISSTLLGNAHVKKYSVSHTDCQYCGYDLSYDKVTDCPECGQVNEQWLHDNPKAMKMVQEGLEQARKGEFVDPPNDFDDPDDPIDPYDQYYYDGQCAYHNAEDFQSEKSLSWRQGFIDAKNGMK